MYKKAEAKMIYACTVTDLGLQGLRSIRIHVCMFVFLQLALFCKVM